MIVKKGKLRADARLNRGHILHVAREAFAADPAASLNSIAKSAGVGAGTLYRHFSNREALLAAVYGKEIDAVVDLAPTLLGAHAPFAALRLWCESFAEFGSVKHGLADTLRAAMSDQELQDSYRRLVEAVRLLMKAGEEDGSVRPGVKPEDVLVLLSSVLRIAPTPEGRSQVARVIALILRGLGTAPNADP